MTNEGMCNIPSPSVCHTTVRLFLPFGVGMRMEKPYKELTHSKGRCIGNTAYKDPSLPTWKGLSLGTHNKAQLIL